MFMQTNNQILKYLIAVLTVVTLATCAPQPVLAQTSTNWNNFVAPQGSFVVASNNSIRISCVNAYVNQNCNVVVDVYLNNEALQVLVAGSTFYWTPQGTTGYPSFISGFYRVVDAGSLTLRDFASNNLFVRTLKPQAMCYNLFGNNSVCTASN